MNSTTKKANEDYAVNVLTTEEARLLFDQSVKETLGIDSSQFITNYQKGAYEDRDDCDIMSLLMLLPFTGYSAQYGKQTSCGKQILQPDDSKSA
ncbi:MAG: hypothetical protein K8F91_22745 [Candidatus Obscuribacterales bacterium]|nr:hypothetical protein [Candidatus Obscuribacterales bacterium]